MARTATIKGGRKPKKTKSKPESNVVDQNVDQVLTPPTVDQKLEKFRQSQTKQKSWMWLGVISISAIIFFFWGWSLVNNISLFSWKRTQENNMVKKTQTDWNNLFTKTEQAEKDKQQLKEQLGTIINEIKRQAEIDQTTTASSTTSTSSTLEISTTTTSTIR